MSESLVGRASRVRRDLVALGPMAPVRAGYEVVKRSGAHGAMLRRFVARSSPKPLIALPAFAAPLDLPRTARELCLADAEEITSSGHRIFGTRLPVAGPDDWNQLPNGRAWPANSPWWDIDIRTEERLGDVKWTWELGRHRDLVVLARAAHLEPDGPWLSELEARLRWWFEASPSEVGIHWYSNLEVALRVIAWMQIYALVSDRFDSGLRTAMSVQVAQAKRHLLFDFPYTASSMRNNHLLGDALGIIAIDRFTGGDGSSRTVKLAERFFSNQLRRHMHSDGSMIEDSLSYHRFVMEMLSVKILLGASPSEAVTALGSSAQHLVRLGVFDGSLPQWGDWDEGRVLASSGVDLDCRGSVALALALGDQGTVPSWREDYDEVAWYAPRRVTTVFESPNVDDCAPPSGGIVVASQGDWRVWFKTGLEQSHQHADLTHVSIQYRGDWVAVDPGTGTYNGPLKIRNAFRTSSAHNGLRVDGSHLLTPHRAFRWLGEPNGAGTAALEIAQAKILFATHDAFSSEHGTRVARAVVISTSGVTCIDWLEHSAQSKLCVPLAPGSSVVEQGVLLANGTELVTTGFEAAETVEGSDSPFEGWFSRTYGEWIPSPWIKVQNSAKQTSAWGFYNKNSALPIQDADKWTVGSVCISATFHDGVAQLSVRADDAEHLMNARSDAS